MDTEVFFFNSNIVLIVVGVVVVLLACACYCYTTHSTIYTGWSICLLYCIIENVVCKSSASCAVNVRIIENCV